MQRSSFLNSIQQAFEKLPAQKFRKGTILTDIGQVEHHLFFISEGAVKIYYQSALNEHVIRLGYTGSMINSLTSFYSEKPSELVIEVIRESSIKMLHRDAILNIKKNSSGYPEFLEQLLIQQLERELDLLQDSPTERLNRVLARSPQLFQHVPLKYIASYLRMTPETLSRIRKS